MLKETSNIQSIAQLQTKKKLSFFSAMFIVIGSCIGAGIFFKSKSVLSNVGGNTILAMFSWGIAIFAIAAMALALIEIASATKKSNLSFVGWNKMFNSRIMYKASKNFMFYIYLPLMFFFMPLYFIQTIMDAWTSFGKGVDPILNISGDWVIWTIISIAITLYFLIIPGINAKLGNLHNKIILLFKFFPLLFAGFAGFILLALGSPSTASLNIKAGKAIIAGGSIATLTPGFGMFIGIGGIFFAYDGFYVSSGLQSEMEKPKKTPIAILLGLGIVTVIYLTIALSMSIVGNGSITSFQGAMTSVGVSEDTAYIIMGIVNFLIAIGILGIINGFSMWTPRYVEELIQNDEIPFTKRLRNKLNAHKPLVGLKVTLIITLPMIIIFTLIGALGYSNTSDYAYGPRMNALYSFADIISTWTSVIAFAFIAVAIYGGLKNRKTNKVVVEKYKNFKVFAIIAVILVGFSMVMTILIPIVNLCLLAIVDSASLTNELILRRIIIIIILLLYVGIMFIPTLIEDVMKKTTHKKLSIN